MSTDGYRDPYARDYDAYQDRASFNRTVGAYTDRRRKGHSPELTANADETRWWVSCAACPWQPDALPSEAEALAAYTTRHENGPR